MPQFSSAPTLEAAVPNKRHNMKHMLVAKEITGYAGGIESAVPLSLITQQKVFFQINQEWPSQNC